MDRLNGSAVAFPAAAEPPAPGWDPRAVWRDRIAAPRRREPAREPPAITVADTSAGWDPLETWRLRVRRPRRTGK